MCCAADWLLKRQVRVRGDWSVKLPKVKPGGWAFEYANNYYPDIDDTAVALIALAPFRNDPEFKAKGIDRVLCLAVNDAFVMKAWGEQNKVDGKVEMLPDGNAVFTKALGLEMDGSGFGLGTRGQRFALYAVDGVVKDLQVEKPGAFEVSSAEYMLERV